VRAQSKPIEFRPEAAQPFDDRILSWWMDRRTVSIWTTAGRLTDIGFVGDEDQPKLLAASRKGESDLLCRDGEYYLVATLDLDDPEIRQPSAFLGVDLGVVNIATRSDGVTHGGRGLQRHRKRMRDLRTKLQKKGTKSAKRRAKLLSGREKRRATDLNHCLAKSIVVEAERTGHGIAIEDLHLGGEGERRRHADAATGAVLRVDVRADGRRGVRVAGAPPPPVADPAVSAGGRDQENVPVRAVERHGVLGGEFGPRRGAGQRRPMRRKVQSAGCGATGPAGLSR
jgi:hypothetical protein